MKLGWLSYAAVESGAPGKPGSNIGRGYYNFNKNLLSAVRELMEVVVVTQEDIVVNGAAPPHPRFVLHACPPHVFTPIQGKVNILFTMWEGDTIPSHFLPHLAAAQVLIVPSQYCKEVFERAGFSSLVIPLGLASQFTTCDTGRPILVKPGQDRRLKFLALASAQLRKGWDVLGAAWELAFNRGGHNVQITVKTIGVGGRKEYYDGRVIVDQRDLSDADILALYLESDVFICPSLGEGFGLPALEAMASGCLVCSTQAGGLSGFVNDQTAVVIPATESVVLQYGDSSFRAMIPSTLDVAAAMVACYQQWGERETEQIRKTGTEFARNYTWAQTAGMIRLLIGELYRASGHPQTGGLRLAGA